MQLPCDGRFLLGLSVGLGLGWLLPQLLGRGRRGRARCGEAALLGPVYLALCKHLHGTLRGPFDGLRKGRLPVQDHSYGHTNLPVEFLRPLLRRLRASFLVEIGSFKGGSALRIAAAAAEVAAEELGRRGKPCLLCVDTFLGDAAMWLDHNAGWRDWLMLENGLPGLYWQFMANVESMRDIILPLPLASMCALRALHRLAVRGDVPMPDFIYLDSAHEKGETLLEITQAFRLVRAGGVLLGDDLDWPAVESDLHAFLGQLGEGEITGAEDEVLAGVPGLVFCPAPAPGYWVVDSSPRQWLLRKQPGGGGEGQLQALRAFLGGEENGEAPAEYVPLTAADRAAVAIYDEAVAFSEDGRMAEAIAGFKQAAERSASLAFHYKL